MGDDEQKSINLDLRSGSAERMVEKYQGFWVDLDPELAALAKQVTEATELVGGRKAAADIMGVGPTTLDNYRSGKTQPKTLEFSRLMDARLAAVGRYFGQKRADSANVLAESRAAAEKQLLKTKDQKGTIPPRPEMVGIARYAVQASAGGGAVAIAQDVEDFFYVNRDWLASIAPRGARLGMLGGRGDSMEPTISDGDVLIVTFDVARQDLAAGGVFVFTYEGDIYLKRLSLALDGSVQVISDNPSYPMQTIAAEVAEAKLEINARVIWAGGRLR